MINTIINEMKSFTSKPINNGLLILFKKTTKSFPIAKWSTNYRMLYKAKFPHNFSFRNRTRFSFARWRSRIIISTIESRQQLCTIDRPPDDSSTKVDLVELYHRLINDKSDEDESLKGVRSRRKVSPVRP